MVETLTTRDDLQIRRLVLAPGEATAWHRDVCERFTVVVRGSRLRIEYRTPVEVVDLDVHPGQVGWDMPEPRVHRAVNVGADDYEEVVTFFLAAAGQVPQPEPAG
ncbi:MAG: hypothetical protein RIC56_06980 [Pseudomonadales bacterium]